MKLFKIKSELEPHLKDTFAPVDIPKKIAPKAGVYFHRFVDGNTENEACNYSFFSNRAVKEELIQI